jgi:hypothetical protein
MQSFANERYRFRTVPRALIFFSASSFERRASLRTRSLRHENYGSVLQVKLASNFSAIDFDHFGEIGVLRRTLARDDNLYVRDVERGWPSPLPFANILGLQPDRGLKFFAAFCWLSHDALLLQG